MIIIALFVRALYDVRHAEGICFSDKFVSWTTMMDDPDSALPQSVQARACRDRLARITATIANRMTVNRAPR